MADLTISYASRPSSLFENQPNHPGVNSALFQGGSASRSVYQTLDTPTPIMCHDTPLAHDKRDWFRMPIDNKNMSGHTGAPVPGCILGIESLYSQKSANTAPGTGAPECPDIFLLSIGILNQSLLS